MPAISLGYLPVLTKALCVEDATNFTTTIATQGLYTQGGTPAVTNFVAFSREFDANDTITGVSARVNYDGTPGTKSTISCFRINARTGTITALAVALLDTGTGDHEISLPMTVPVKLTGEDKIVVFVGGMTGGSGGMTCSGCLASYVKGP